jgi:hypothetical protein
MTPLTNEQFTAILREPPPPNREDREAMRVFHLRKQIAHLVRQQRMIGALVQQLPPDQRQDVEALVAAETDRLRAKGGK